MRPKIRSFYYCIGSSFASKFWNATRTNTKISKIRTFQCRRPTKTQSRRNLKLLTIYHENEPLVAGSLQQNKNELAIEDQIARRFVGMLTSVRWLGHGRQQHRRFSPVRAHEAVRQRRFITKTLMRGFWNQPQGSLFFFFSFLARMS